jgi:hypothetical protein
MKLKPQGRAANGGYDRKWLELWQKQALAGPGTEGQRQALWGLGRDEAGHRVLDLSDAALHGCDNAASSSQARNGKPPGRLRTPTMGGIPE